MQKNNFLLTTYIFSGENPKTIDNPPTIQISILLNSFLLIFEDDVINHFTV